MDFNEDAITFESIIGRQPRSIIFDAKEIANLCDERILVTGAGGSIGSQIIKTIARIEGIKYLATDRDEGALHSLSLELDSRALFESPQIALLDIRDQIGVNQILSAFKPTLIIHAAALKHLNALQKQPREATLSNVFGTANLVDAAIMHRIPKFVNISTDKAAEPKNVLGYSKKMAELYVAKARADGHIGYTSCRFGNVFNSRGSVIETFIYQIVNDKPITLTHPKIERFFMSIEEAAYLTIKSALINNGDVHIFDMGEPIPLAEIIENLQSALSHRSAVLVTGLRDGEKMSEDLFGSTEESFATLEPRIKFANLSIELNKNMKLLNRIKIRDEASISWELSGMTNSAVL
jgi:nucleoside-diphosphate-sugar epimerase